MGLFNCLFGKSEPASAAPMGDANYCGAFSFGNVRPDFAKMEKEMLAREQAEFNNAPVKHVEVVKLKNELSSEISKLKNEIHHLKARMKKLEAMK